MPRPMDIEDARAHLVWVETLLKSAYREIGIPATMLTEGELRTAVRHAEQAIKDAMRDVYKARSMAGPE